VTPEPGWYPDPYFLKRERYWDGAWTDQVRVVEDEHRAVQLGDAAVTSGVEAPPTETVPAVYPTDTGFLVTRAQAPTGTTAVVHEDDTLVVPVSAGPVDTAAAPAPAAAAAAADTDTATVPATSPDTDTGIVRSVTRDAPPPASQFLLGGRPTYVAEEEAAARARHRRLVFAALAVIVVAAVIVVVVAARGSGNGHPTTGSAAAPVVNAPPANGVSSPSAASSAAPSAAPSVQTAATVSLAKKAVVVSVALSPAVSSPSIPQQTSGDGAFVVDSGTGPLTISSSGKTAPTQKLVFQGQVVYINVTKTPVPGKSWVVASTNNLPALGPGEELSTLIGIMGNPGLLLQELASIPLSVTPLGSASVDGTSVHRYQVSFNSGPTASSAAGFGNHISEEVDVGADRLVHQIVIAGPQVSVDGQAVQENIVVVFSHYGKPLIVTTPPFAQMMSLTQYLTALEAPSPS
jgi:Protein of unknown function (DUF2510)